ncbi:PepSY domain-containing protein [Comamonadaceae bacterium M7527]|nr:PepSY domain-containing protein [Comamonadaceae bacterium M7527]
MSRFCNVSPAWKLCLALVLGACLGLPALADDDDDHYQARAALLAGDIHPLSDVLNMVAQRYPGRVIKVELEREHAQWVYEIKMVSPRGALIKLEVNATDLSVRSKGKRP